MGEQLTDAGNLMISVHAARETFRQTAPTSAGKLEKELYGSVILTAQIRSALLLQECLHATASLLRAHRIAKDGAKKRIPDGVDAYQTLKVTAHGTNR